MLSTHTCIYVSSRSVKTKEGKTFVMLSFVGDDGNLYADVYVDAGFSDVLSLKSFGDSILLELEITRYNSQWRVSINSIS